MVQGRRQQPAAFSQGVPTQVRVLETRPLLRVLQRRLQPDVHHPPRRIADPHHVVAGGVVGEAQRAVVLVVAAEYPVLPPVGRQGTVEHVAAGGPRAGVAGGRDLAVPDLDDAGALSRRARQEVRTFPTHTAGLLELADWLAAGGVTHAAMEPTGVY
jgi:hypothetical protein